MDLHCFMQELGQLRAAAAALMQYLDQIMRPLGDSEGSGRSIICHMTPMQSLTCHGSI